MPHRRPVLLAVPWLSPQEPLQCRQFHRTIRHPSHFGPPCRPRMLQWRTQLMDREQAGMNASTQSSNHGRASCLGPRRPEGALAGIAAARTDGHRDRTAHRHPAKWARCKMLAIRTWRRAAWTSSRSGRGRSDAQRDSVRHRSTAGDCVVKTIAAQITANQFATRSEARITGRDQDVVRLPDTCAIRPAAQDVTPADGRAFSSCAIRLTAAGSSTIPAASSI